jgi:uncharacterized protein (TIGR00730 family)
MIKRVCVFCGSSKGFRPAYVKAAHDLGKALVRRGTGLVFGGGRMGLMGELADTAMAGGGEVLGVIPQALVSREVAHREITELVIVRSMHERKAKMMELADAFVAMPGGYGTLEEFCEVITWAQLGLHQKPCGLLNVEGYYDSLLNLFNRGVDDGFIHPTTRELVVEAADPDVLLDKLAYYKPPIVEKWIEQDES